MAGDIGIKDERVFRTMLVLDSVRGEDSTGVASVEKFANAEVTIAKEVGHPFNLFDTKRFDRLMGKSHRVLIGHNRYATQGAINAKNAHPFEFDGLVGVHNGTLSNKSVLLDHKDFVVDSENLYHHINEKGLEDAISLATGAWALVWWDKYEETLNFLRNKERPLFFCYAEGAQKFYWASEAWMLDIALDRADIKHTEPFMLEEDMHYSVPIAMGGKLHKPKVFPIQSHGKAGAGVVNLTPARKGNKSAHGAHSTSDTRFPASKYDLDYLGSKDVLLEAIALCQDVHGGEYVSCFDKDKPFFEVRLYVHPAHDVDLNIGCEFTGSISAYSPLSNTEGFYKVSPSSVIRTVSAEDKASDKEEERRYETGNGKQLDEKSWRKAYSSCACCGDQVSPLDGTHKFTTYNDVICGGCIAEDNELLQYVTLK